MNKNFAMMVLQTVSHTRAGGLSPAFYEYNEQAATVRTPALEKNIDAPDIQQERVKDTGPGIGSAMTELLISKQHRANSIARIGSAILARLPRQRLDGVL